MIEDVEMTMEGSIFTGFDYRESTPFSNIDETIIREAELDVLTLGDDLSEIYDESRPSSKKRKRDVDICECNSSVFVVWKKNIADFSSRAITVVSWFATDGT